MPKLLAVKLDKNPWHCDCRSIYLARWLREYGTRLWDGNPLCLGPGELGGKSVNTLRFDDLCGYQWASMVNVRIFLISLIILPNNIQSLSPVISSSSHQETNYSGANNTIPSRGFRRRRTQGLSKHDDHRAPGL